MTTLAMWQLIIGTLVPPVIAVVQRPHFPGWLRVFIMLVLSVAASIVVLAVRNELDMTNWLHTAGLVVLGAIAAYHGIWKPSGIAPSIEVATTPPLSPIKPVAPSTVQ